MVVPRAVHALQFLNILIFFLKNFIDITWSELKISINSNDLTSKCPSSEHFEREKKNVKRRVCYLPTSRWCMHSGWRQASSIGSGTFLLRVEPQVTEQAPHSALIGRPDRSRSVRSRSVGNFFLSFFDKYQWLTRENKRLSRTCGHLQNPMFCQYLSTVFFFFKTA